MGCKKELILKIPLSFVALSINMMPKGNNTNVASQPPIIGDTVFDSAMFLPKVEMKK